MVKMWVSLHFAEVIIEKFIIQLCFESTESIILEVLIMTVDDHFGFLF